MTEQIINQSGLRELAQYIADSQQTEVYDAAAFPQFVSVSSGMKLESSKRFVDEWRLTPERAKGQSQHTTIASFLRHIAAFKDDGTAIFANANPADPRVLAVYNYNEAQDKPRFGDFRAELKLELSDEWKIWTAQAKDSMDQSKFAEFIEANISDIQDAPDLTDPNNEVLKQIAMTLAYPFAGQADMMKLSKGIEINQATKAKVQLNLQTGERVLQFEAENSGADGAKLTIPGLFLIAIPVFKDAHIYRLPVRLRYRSNGSGVTWWFDIYRDDKAFKLAYAETCYTIENNSGIEVYVGQPEGR